MGKKRVEHFRISWITRTGIPIHSRNIHDRRNNRNRHLTWFWTYL
uniref:Uncharacterized protein n=1 Tax=Arundo donax TaxID=35708 RepID=A0A0A9D902_ARUDO